MKTQITDELRAFHLFLGEKLANGGADMSPEEAVDAWRDLHPEEELDEEVAAIQEALDDMANGDRGMPIAEFDRQLRKEFNFPELPRAVKGCE